MFSLRSTRSLAIFIARARECILILSGCTVKKTNTRLSPVNYPPAKWIAQKKKRKKFCRRYRTHDRVLIKTGDHGGLKIFISYLDAPRLKSMKRVDDLPPFPSLSLSFSLTRRQPSLLYPLFLSALSPFRLVSHPISGPHPRGFSPLQPDSSISRGSKSCRFYEPPRRAYIYTLRVCARTRAHRDTRTKVCRIRDLRYSSDGALSGRKISLPYKEAEEKSRGKIAHFL